MRWCVDITYIPTREGWLYLAAVEDLFSRMIVGGSMESRLVVNALETAIRRRRPETGLVARSDRESQYASDHYPWALAAEGIVCSPEPPTGWSRCRAGCGVLRGVVAPREALAQVVRVEPHPEPRGHPLGHPARGPQVRIEPILGRGRGEPLST
ncbi:transposase : Marine sediment metagenome DNA, contig: S03H2_S04256 (Fragment) OS=marine sediment metagenome GN=S03H2_33945 PE=4 SV=1: rve [Gemmata massiliana]|uniref:Integrase catalytic domain-containing protein n=1 Tax=Gemmata massiliana TaxID=1210884 RepID=A0A6P2CVX8_9BACT